jgi:hypothetical protein
LGDPRYGVIVDEGNDELAEHFLETLGVHWYLNYSPFMSNVPSGYKKMPHIQVNDKKQKLLNRGETEDGEKTVEAGPGLLTPEEIAILVGQAPPGRVWYVAAEPNWGGRAQAADYAWVYRYYYDNIKAIDPNAKVSGPSVLNWDFKCAPTHDGDPGCDYTAGLLWMNQFFGAYQALTDGDLPPVDVWTMDVYPIDFFNIPNQDPSQPVQYEGGPRTHWYVAQRQIEKFRSFLNANGYAGTPIWITEIAAHVGFDFWTRDATQPSNPIVASRFATFYWDFMADYMHDALDWFEANSASMKIEHWFWFVTWVDVYNRNDGYLGITLFDSPGQDSNLNCLGELYRARSLDLSRRTCDRDGNVVFLE